MREHHRSGYPLTNAPRSFRVLPPRPAVAESVRDLPQPPVRPWTETAVASTSLLPSLSAHALSSRLSCSHIAQPQIVRLVFRRSRRWTIAYLPRHRFTSSARV